MNEQSNLKERLRQLPAVQTILRSLEDDVASVWQKAAVQEVLGAVRQGVSKGHDMPSREVLLEWCRLRAHELAHEHLRPVINATGVLIHTNLGRSPLPKEMMAHLSEVATQYSTLEYRLDEGVRGSRHEHVEGLLASLVGAPAAMVVNNNAAAVLLALSTLAKDKEVVVSRGELVEIGGSFRVPEVMALSGAHLVEVGATNKTHLYDYERAIGENTGLLLKVHQSNFRQIGFVEAVSSQQLASLGHSRGLPVMEDLGSGVILPIMLEGYTEPTVRDVLSAGLDVVTFSGDKLLGGPQAGIIVGQREWIERMKKHPLARAVRVDKMTLAVLESVIRWYHEGRGRDLPLWRMIYMPLESILRRSEAVVDALRQRCSGIELSIESDWSEVGGGSMPGTRLETYVIALNESPSRIMALERQLRRAPTPIISRVVRNRLVMDLRTVFEDQEDLLIETLAAAYEALMQS